MRGFESVVSATVTFIKLFSTDVNHHLIMVDGNSHAMALLQLQMVLWKWVLQYMKKNMNMIVYDVGRRKIYVFVVSVRGVV